MDCGEFNSSQCLHELLFAASNSEWLTSCCQQHGGFLSDHCVPLIVHEANCWATDAPRVLRCSTTLTRISAILIEFGAPLSVCGQCLLLAHCLRFLDFPSVESIGYQCVGLLLNLVQLHTANCCKFIICFFAIRFFLGQCCQKVDKNCEWLLSVGRSLCDGAPNELFSKIRIKALHSLLRCPSVEGSLPLRDHLLTDAFIERLFLQIGHAPLSVQISKLIVDDCALSVRLNRLQRLNLYKKWIKKQLLAPDTSVRQAIEQKLLPALLKSPEPRRWFRSEFAAFASLPRDSPHSPRALCTLLRLAIDRIGNEEGNCDFGWEDFVTDDKFSGGANGGLICTDFMAKALLSGSSDSETQLSALSLLCSHPKGARPVSATECHFVRQFVAKSFAEPSPSVRHQILSQLAKLFSRISEHSKSLKKLNDAQSLAKNRQFVNEVEQLALDHLPKVSSITLSPAERIEKDDDETNDQNDTNLSFSSRIFALALISQIHSAELSDPSFALCEFDSLIASLDDQFELCQDTALKLIVDHSVPKGIAFDFTDFLQNTKSDLLFTNPHTPRHQLAMEYRLRFVLPRLHYRVRLNFFSDLIELGANVCDKMCRDGAQNSNTFLLLQIKPQLHAILSAIFVTMSHILRPDENATKNDEPDAFLDALLLLCHRCASLVSPVVHSLSPEGFLPFTEQSRATFGEDNFKTVQLLSKTCWRSHKCISHIFSRLIEWMPTPNSLSNDQLTKIGEYFWLQLTECRHCGAFEAAANAFRVVCLRFWFFSSTSDQFPCSPAKWLQQIVDALSGRCLCALINGRAQYCKRGAPRLFGRHKCRNMLQNVFKWIHISARHLCPSRRSAGLPHLVSALLCSEPPLCPNRRQFPYSDRTLSALLDCRGLTNRQLEFHCVNVLRLLFSQAQLEERIFPYVEEAFRLSLDGCADEFWPVRNAHVQLFAALIKRVFGTPPAQQRTLHIQQKCKMSAHEFFTRKFPVQLRMAVLRSPSSSDCPLGVLHHFSAFPALILLTHLRPVAHAMGQTHSLRPFMPDLIQLLFVFPARALREIASAALCSMATFAELQEIFDCILAIGLSFHQMPQKVPTLAADSIQIFLGHITELNLDKLTSTDRFHKLSEIAKTLRNNKSDLGHIRETIYDELLRGNFTE